MRRRWAWIAASLIVTAGVPVAPAAEPGISWEPYRYRTRTGETIEDCELGKLQVPEKHDLGTGRTIELACVRFRSTAPIPAPPIVWLAGGPGDHGSDDIEGPYLALVREFQKVADVIALDQRGTGLSRPLLVCPEKETWLPLDRPYDRDAALRESLQLARDCAEHFTSMGIDLSAYNSVESAHDVDLLRRALGVPKVNLYGASYGTHLAFAVLRYHPEVVERVVLSGVEGPDQTWKLPTNIDAHLQRVFEAARRADVASQYGADLETMVRTVLERLHAAPVSVEAKGENGKPVRVTLGASDLRLGLRAFLGSRSNIAIMPRIFAGLYRGDYGPTAAYLLRLRQISVWSAMSACMDCASGASAERLARIQKEAETSMAGIVDFPYPEICAAWPHARLDDAFRSTLRVDHPTLFLSGTLDGQTPPSNAAEVAAGFARATHIRVEGGSHAQLELEPMELTSKLAAFLRGDAIADTTFLLPIEFAPPE